MAVADRHQTEDAKHVWTKPPEGRTNIYSDPEGQFTIIAKAPLTTHKILRMDAYSAAMAFVQGKFDVHGSIISAIKYFSQQPHSPWRQVIFSGLARLEHLRIASVLGCRRSTARAIQFHYDRPNEFYSQFLDSRMVYSAACFVDAYDSLEKAQTQKLERICRDLRLRPDDCLLDIGCGWGGLVTYAAERFGVKAIGCTLAEQQVTFAQHIIEQHSLGKRASVMLRDYRSLDGRFDKIASVGMFEHVGHARLRSYFNKVFELLNPGGLFLNRGIVRPQGVCDGPETFFLQKHVFPGGELVHLDDVVREGERVGFAVVGLRDLHRDYALTCKAWVNRLQTASARCSALVGDTTYRTWLLYLAASAIAFEDHKTSASQVLFMKRRNQSIL